MGKQEKEGSTMLREEKRKTDQCLTQFNRRRIIVKNRVAKGRRNQCVGTEKRISNIRQSRIKSAAAELSKGRKRREEHSFYHQRKANKSSVYQIRE
jgi:hypothetical protein